MVLNSFFQNLMSLKSSVRDDSKQNETLQTIAKQTGLLNHRNWYCHWNFHSFLIYAVGSRFFTHYIANSFRRAQLASFDIGCHYWHTPQLWKPAKDLVQNTRNACQVFGGKSPCRVTIIGTRFGFKHRRFSKLSHSSASSRCAATVTFCRHVAYGVETSSCQSVPQVTKGLSISCCMEVWPAVHALISTSVFTPT